MKNINAIDSSVYRVSVWLYFFAVINFLIAIGFASLFAIFPDSGISPFSEFSFLAIAFAALSVTAILVFISTKIVISRGQLYFRCGLKKTAINLCEVQQILVKGFFIIVDNGKIPRFIIPRIFSKEHMLTKEMRASLKG